MLSAILVNPNISLLHRVPWPRSHIRTLFLIKLQGAERRAEDKIFLPGTRGL
jgi:hypothetical protein